MQIAGKGTKLANGFLGAVFANGHEVKIGSDINAGSMEIDPFKNVLANFCFAPAAGWVFLCQTYLGYLVAGLFTF